MPVARLTVLMCAAEVLTMVGAFGFPALLPAFIVEWSLSNTEAGWIGGIHLGAYAIAAPLLVALTDRVDARLIHGAGAALTALAFAGFAVYAAGFWSAMLFRFVAGLGLAATYMPGLRALVDRISGPRQPRAVAFYTASFSLGVAVSFLVIGEAGAAWGWRAAFWIAAAAALLPVAAVLLLLAPAEPQKPEDQTPIWDFRPVLRNRAAMGYVVAYGAHTYELFAFRGWIVAFLAFSLTLQPDGTGWPSPTAVATISGLVAMAASIAGGEAATRWGRQRTIATVMIASGVLALVIGFLPGITYGAVVALILVYSVTVQADSAALTTGAVGAAQHGRRGATLAVHAFVGFLGGAAGPVVVGAVLDIAGGAVGAWAWGLAFAAMGLPCLLAPLVFMRLGAARGER
jgi:MFS family permease